MKLFASQTVTQNNTL